MSIIFREISSKILNKFINKQTTTIYLSMNSYIQVLTKYAEFNGRAWRSEYWYLVLFNTLISAIIFLISLLIGLWGILSLLYSIAVFIPGIAVSVRRFHDTGRSGGNLLLAFIPIIGAVILLVFFFQDSVVGDNEYGIWPK